MIFFNNSEKDWTRRKEKRRKYPGAQPASVSLKLYHRVFVSVKDSTEAEAYPKPLNSTSYHERISPSP